MWQDKPIILAVASHPIFWAKTAQSHLRLLQNFAPRKSAGYGGARILGALSPPDLRRRNDSLGMAGGARDAECSAQRRSRRAARPHPRAQRRHGIGREGQDVSDRTALDLGWSPRRKIPRAVPGKGAWPP